jgi:hypothetical protein
MSLIGELEPSFDRLSPRIQAGFARWQLREPILAEFASVEDLIAFCRNRDRTLYSAKNEAIAALCRLATSVDSPGGDAEAGVLLVYLFIGAFRNIGREIGPSLLSLDELDSEMLSGFWEEATRVRTSHRAASTRLYHAARRSAWEAVRKARNQASTTVEMDAATAVPGSISSNPSQVLERAVREGVISAIQCELIGAIRVDGTPTTRVAQSVGLTRAAASMQLTRGERRLAAWLTASGAQLTN